MNSVVMRKTGRKGSACHIYLDREQSALLDAIGAAMGRRRLGAKASRSQLISTAIRNFIDDCHVEEDLKEAMDQARQLIRDQELLTKRDETGSI